MSEMNLKSANENWSARPADERFWTRADLRAYLERRDGDSTERTGKLVSWRGASDGLRVDDENGSTYRLSPWAMAQACRRLGAPADFLGTLRPGTAAMVLQERTGSLEGGKDWSLYVDQSGAVPTLRAALSERYERIRDSFALTALDSLAEQGWVVPPAWHPGDSRIPSRIATESDTGPHTLVKAGNVIAPSGLYASDRDVWAIMVDPNRRVNDGTGAGSFRGIMLSNSEVGFASMNLCGFLMSAVCGNHNILDGSIAFQATFRHVGDVQSKLADALRSMRAYVESSPIEEEQSIARARSFVLGGDTQDAVVEYLYGKRIGTQSLLKEAYATAVAHEADGHGLPSTAWGFSQGLTRLSQQRPNFGDRRVVDAVASKVLALAR